MPDPHLTNPAGRLFLLLSDVRALNPDTPLRQAWAKVLAVDEDDFAALLARFSLVFRLPSQVRGAVETLPDTYHDLALRHLPTVEKTLQNPFNNKVEWLTKQISPATLQGVEFASTLLSQHRREPTPEEENLASLKETLEELLSEVLDSDLDSALADRLAGHLRAMIEAIAEHRIAGIEPLVGSTNSLVGDALLSQSWGQPKRPLIKKIIAVAVSTVIFLGGLSQALELPGNVAEVFNIGPQEVAEADAKYLELPPPPEAEEPAAETGDDMTDGPSDDLDSEAEAD